MGGQHSREAAPDARLLPELPDLPAALRRCGGETGSSSSVLRNHAVSQLNGPKAFGPAGAFAPGSIVSRSHSSGNVLPVHHHAVKVRHVVPRVHESDRSARRRVSHVHARSATADSRTVHVRVAVEQSTRACRSRLYGLRCFARTARSGLMGAPFSGPHVGLGLDQHGSA